MGLEIVALADTIKFYCGQMFELLGAALWPLLVLFALITLHRPIVDLIGRVRQVDVPGASVKLGNERASELKREAEENAETVLDSLDEPIDEVEPNPAEESGQEGQGLDPERFIRYYWRIVNDRLQSSGYNTSTSSARLAGEIVGSTYADLKQLLRVVGYVRGVGGSRGKLTRMDPLIERLELPDNLRNDVQWARRFAEDVTNGAIQVDGKGAADFIYAVRITAELVVRWAIRDNPSAIGQHSSP